MIKKDNSILDRSLEFILDNINSCKIVIVGAGYRGMLLWARLLERKIYPVCFFDNNESTWTLGGKDGILIQKPMKLEDDVNYVVAVDNPVAKGQLKRQLLDLSIQENQIFIYYADNYSFWKNLRPEYYIGEISALYRNVFQKEMCWNDPQTYNEKINWEKLYANDPIKTRLADKYLVREWIKEKIGEEYLNTLYGVWNNANDIDFERLPDAFVLKCNHGSGWNIIVKDKKKINVENVKKQLNTWLNLNTAYMGFEMQYKDIQPKIICEKYLVGVAETLYDYNIYCFHGKPKYIWCIKGSHRPGCVASFYDKDWRMQDFSYGYPIDPIEAPRPKQLEKMLELSEKLSKDFEHVRVDWYNMPDGKIIFGEMTFSSWNGLHKFEPEEWDMKFGKLI